MKRPQAGTEPDLDRTIPTKAIGGAALILMLGNLAGSVFGFLRQTVMADVFGGNVKTDAFVAASIVPQMFYDLVIGAAVSAALIPTFTEILERRGKDELWRTVGSVLALVWLALAALVVVLMVLARPLMDVILIGYQQKLRAGGIDVAVSIARVLIPTLFFLGTSAVLTATLYSLRRFTVPAFSASLYHVGVIAGALVLAHPLGIMALPAGALAGAGSQAIAQAAALLRQRPHVRLRLELSPEIRHILRLYGPVAAGLIISIVGQVLDIGFKSRQGEAAVTAMWFATTLTQFPIGIAVAAMSFAVLPSISSDVAFERMEMFKDTLGMGIRLVLFLTIPAAVGYLALSSPIVSFLYEHGKFSSSAASLASVALVGYSIQIPFVGLDQMLIFAFYARKDTRTPMLVGVAGVGIYVLCAILLGPRLHVLGLALANTIQNSMHAMILLVLLFSSVGTLAGRGVIASLFRSLLAALAMGITTAALAAGIERAVNTHAFLGQILAVLVPLVPAAVVYVAVAAALRSPELSLAWTLARRRLRR